MHLTVSSDMLDILKSHLRQMLPDTDSSLRMEAVARGCGFRTYAGLRAGLANGPVQVLPNENVFLAFLGNPAVSGACPDRPLSHAIARTMLIWVLNEHPALTERGYDSIWQGGREEERKSREERLALLAERRKQAYESAWAADQFELALIYLSRQGRIKSPNRKMGSYGLKHRAENLSRKFGLFEYLGDYVSNGMLLAAAYASGFTVTPDGGNSPNGLLNISMRTINLSRGLDRTNRYGDSDLDANLGLVRSLYGNNTVAA
jgi:hypothetical protein